MNDLLSVKELAVALRRSTSYIYAMRNAGFPMPGGRARIHEAMTWLHAHGDFRMRYHRRRTRHKMPQVTI